MIEKKLMTNTEWCKGCGLCVAFCPKEVLTLVNGKVFIAEPEKCVLCGSCESRCPDYAVYIEEREVKDE